MKELRTRGEDVLVDGDPIQATVRDVEFVRGGDDSDPVISAASVVAKYERERSPDKEKRKSWKTR